MLPRAHTKKSTNLEETGISGSSLALEILESLYIGEKKKEKI